MRLRREYLYLTAPFVALSWLVTLPFRDNAVLWHIRAGELQAATGSVLRADPFSVSHGGLAWRTQSWLADLLYARLEQAVSVLGWAPLLMFIVAGATVAFVGLGYWIMTRSVNGAALSMAAGVVLLAPFIAARPTVFSYALLARLIVVVRVERLWWTAVPLMGGGGSVHGSFPVGVGLLVLVAIASRSRKLFGVALLAGATVLLGAHGFGIYEILQAFVANRDALSVISEWQRPDFANPFLLPFLVLGLGVAFRFTRRHLVGGDLIVVGPFLVYALIAERNIPHASIVLLAALSGGWATSLPRPTVRDSRGVSTGERRAVAFGLVAAVAVGMLGLSRNVTWSSQRFPSLAVVGAVTRVEVLSNPAVGGFLVYMAWPAQPIFIDDRAELYGSKLVEVSRALDGDGSVLAKYDLDQVLVRRDRVLAGRLEEAGWVTEAEDEQWVLLRR